LTCREVIGGLGEFSGGELLAGEAKESKRHLARCAPCARYWKSYRTTVALEREAYRDVGPQEMPEDLVAAILAAWRPRLPGFSPRAWHLVHLLSGVAAAPLIAFYLR
jgi:anti-sigma factor RsiW